MSGRGSIRRMFPGGNTSRGFVSFFEYILPGDGYTFVLKGGPGTGKSTFMNRVAAEALAAGIDVEFHHCSADPSSVDAVAFPSLQIAVVDGTAPHVVEPDRYEVSGEIVDLGRWCFREEIRRQGPRIEQLGAEAREAFARSYRWLAAARTVKEEWAANNRRLRDDFRLRQHIAATVADLFDGAGLSAPDKAGPSPNRRGTPPVAGPAGTPPHGAEARTFALPSAVRRLFASSITPDGPKHHLESLLRPLERLFVVTGEPGSGRHELMDAVARAAADRGFYTEVFHCPLDPDLVDHVIIPALGAAVVSSVPPHEYTPLSPPGRQPDVHFVALDPPGGRGAPPAAEPTANRIATAKRVFWQLFRHGVEALQDARTAHLDLEACYLPYVDFDGVEQVRREIRDRILQRRIGAAFLSL